MYQSILRIDQLFSLVVSSIPAILQERAPQFELGWQTGDDDYAVMSYYHGRRAIIKAARSVPTQLKRTFTSTPSTAAAHLPHRPVIKEADLEEAFLRGSGPGGQKINKTSSAVQLKHIPTGTVIKSQATRSRSQNRKIARQLLAEKIEAVEKGPESRTALKADIKRKKKASKSKKARRKHKASQEGAESEAEEETEEMDDEVLEEKVKEERV